ncbi:MAG: hypothetical protein HZA46_24995 [Planctomycetales bacterium]|nr:hypothetical protein [Planctomycetales bacterium]
MTTTSRMDHILLAHLRFSEAQIWPGGDGLTIDVVLASYPQVAAAGQVPDKEELLRLHPDLTVELEAFFSESQFSRSMPPRDSSPYDLATAIRAD